MPSRVRSAPRGKPNRWPKPLNDLASVRAELQQLATSPASPTDTLFNDIAGCKDSLKASSALQCAITASHQDQQSDLILPAPGWLLPP